MTLLHVAFALCVIAIAALLFSLYAQFRLHSMYRENYPTSNPLQQLGQNQPGENSSRGIDEKSNDQTVTISGRSASSSPAGLQTTLFHEYNASATWYGGKLLKLSRLDNRSVMYDKRLLFNLLPAHHYQWVVPYAQNYVSLRYAEEAPIILTLPKQAAMSKQVEWWQQYEDPRVFVSTQGRIFFTSTVFCEKVIRVALVELEENEADLEAELMLAPANQQERHWKIKNAVVLDDAKVVADSFAQKNWSLFSAPNAAGIPATYILTDLHPHMQFYEIDLNTGAMSGRKRESTESLFSSHATYPLAIRCSSGFLQFTAETLICVAHLKGTQMHVSDALSQYPYRTLFVEVESAFPFKPIRVSKIFSFEQDRQRIEFASGLYWNTPAGYVQEDAKLMLCLGVDDKHHRLIPLNPKHIFDEDNQDFSCYMNAHIK